MLQRTRTDDANVLRMIAVYQSRKRIIRKVRVSKDFTAGLQIQVYVAFQLDRSGYIYTGRNDNLSAACLMYLGNSFVKYRCINSCAVTDSAKIGNIFREERIIRAAQRCEGRK